MPSKKTVIVKQKTPKKRPAQPFVQPQDEDNFIDEISVDADEGHEDTHERAPSQKGKQKHTHARQPLNHATDNSLAIDGMEFRRSRGLLDGSTKKTLDIDPEILNPELSYYWCNDEKGLVDQRVELGYQTVPQLLSRTGEKISTRRRVGTQKDGSPLEAVLMATPKTWKKERQDAQENERLRIESGLADGEVDGKQLGKSFYSKTTITKS